MPEPALNHVAPRSNERGKRKREIKTKICCTTLTVSQSIYFVLFGLQQCLLSKFGEVILCEGLYENDWSEEGVLVLMTSRGRLHWLLQKEIQLYRSQ